MIHFYVAHPYPPSHQLLAQQSHDVIDDHQIFGGGNDSDCYRGVFRRNHCRGAHVVAGGIEHDTECAEPGADLGAGVDVVYADAAGNPLQGR